MTGHSADEAERKKNMRKRHKQIHTRASFTSKHRTRSCPQGSATRTPIARSVQWTSFRGPTATSRLGRFFMFASFAR